MAYPTDPPVTKHDLVGVRSLVKSADSDSLATDCRFTSTSELFDSFERSTDPQSLRLLSPVYSYADAPQPPEPPLSRALIMTGVADTSLSAIRKLVHGETVPPCLHKCTIAVKRADPEYMSSLKEQDVVNSHTFAKFMRLLRKENSVAILGKDKHDRLGILVPIDIPSNGDSSFEKDDFVAMCHVGNVEQVKRFLAGGASMEESDNVTMNEAAEASNNGGTTTSLWQPPGSDENGESNADASGGLWQPPGADSSEANDFGGDTNSGFDAWVPSSNDQLSGNKRKLSEDGGGQEFHTDAGAAAADAFYSGLTRSLDTRADSRLYHMRAFNGWVKATQIQELNPRVKGRKPRAPLRVLDLACGKGGDLGKWLLHERGVQNYVGVDVARGSLKDAAIRARKMKKLPKCTFTCADLGSDVPGRLRSPKRKRMQELLSWSRQDESEHEAADPEFKMVRGGGISQNDKFDVVSIQFAIHYMMSSRKRAGRFFQTVSELLEVGGNLIVTTIDARVVMEHMLGLGLNLHFDDDSSSEVTEKGALVQVGGGACRLQFDGDTVRKIFTSSHGSDPQSKDLFGLQYTFTLVEGSDHAAGVGDAVNLPEWLTPIPVLQSLAEEAGLELESVENFHEFFNNRRDPTVYPAAHAALYNMKVLNRSGSISGDEWEVSRMYAALAFRKTKESSMILDDTSGEETEEDDAPDSEAQEAVVEPTKAASLPPALKNKFWPMAMMKVKKSVGDRWKELSEEERNRLTQIEVEKLASNNSS